MKATREENIKNKKMTVVGSRRRGGGGKTNVEDGKGRKEDGLKRRGRVGRER